MRLFEHQFAQLDDVFAGYQGVPEISCFDWKAWPRKTHGALVLEQDTAVELGGERNSSFSAILWTDDASRIHDGQISCYGPELRQIAGADGDPIVGACFGKIILIQAEFPEEEIYSCYEKLERIRFRQNLSGYMLRSASQRDREWVRVSREAVRNGLSFQILGSELIHDLRENSDVKKAEVIFCTDETLLRQLKPVCDKCNEIIHALNKIYDNIPMECGSCSLAALCGEVEGLKKIHEKANG